MHISEEQLREANPDISQEDVGFVQDVGDRNLNADTLRDSEEFEIVPEPVGTEAAGLQGEFEAGVDAFDTNDARLQKEAQDAKQNEEDSFNQLFSELSGQKGKIQLTSEAEEEAGVQPVREEMIQINQDIRVEQNRLTRQIEAIERNATGALRGAVNDNIARVTRESLRTQADLSIIQQGIQGRFDSAKAIADRAVAVQFEQQRNKLETLTLSYERNRDLYTKAEQRAFEATQNTRTRALDAEEAQAQAISDAKIELLKAGAPKEMMLQQFDSLEELMGNYGQFLAPSTGGAPNVVKINGVDSVWNSATQKFEAIALGGQDGVARTAADRKLQQDLELIKELEDNETAINLSAGVLRGGFGTSFVEEFGVGSQQAKIIKQDFLNGIKKLTGNYTLEQLIEKKSRGATFGALSDAELRVISDSASRLNALLQTKDGKIVGVTGSEEALQFALAEFRGEIENGIILNAQRQGGSTSTQNIIVAPDGTPIEIID